MLRIPSGVPEWEGWVVLGTLVVAFAFAGWWLLASPIPNVIRPVAPSERVLRTRRILSGLIAFSGVSLVVGSRWDELWHRMYGFIGNDFLWPPHLLLYGSLALSGVFAGIGLAYARRGAGGLRERFRAEPLMGLLGLLAAYQICSIPSDALWHAIIGIDLSAWSLPHLLLVVTVSSVWTLGVAIALSTAPVRSWRPLWAGWGGDLAALALLVLAELMLLQFGVTEWEWDPFSAFRLIEARPVWAYSIVVLVVGIAVAQIALHVTRRFGAATAVAITALVVQLGFVALSRAALPPGPLLISHLLVVPPALALDVWYAWRRRHASTPATRWGGGIAYLATYLLVSLLYLGGHLPLPPLDSAAMVQIVLVAVPVAFLATYAFSQIGDWLRRLGAENAVREQLGPALRVDDRPKPASVDAVPARGA